MKVQLFMLEEKSFRLVLLDQRKSRTRPVLATRTAPELWLALSKIWIGKLPGR